MLHSPKNQTQFLFEMVHRFSMFNTFPRTANGKMSARGCALQGGKLNSIKFWPIEWGASYKEYDFTIKCITYKRKRKQEGKKNHNSRYNTQRRIQRFHFLLNLEPPLPQPTTPFKKNRRSAYDTLNGTGLQMYICTGLLRILRWL